MKRVIKKLLLSVIAMILILISSSQAVTYAYNIYVKKHRFDGNIYYYGNHIIYDYALNNSSINDYYCLKGGVKVDDGNGYGVYENKVDIASATSVPEGLSGVFRSDNGLSANQSLKAVQWLIRNMYTLSSDKTDNDKAIMKSHLDELIDKYASAYSDCSSYSVSDEYISAVQQFVIWQFVIPASNASYYQGSITGPDSMGNITWGSEGWGYEKSGQRIGFAIYAALYEGATKYAKGESGVMDMPKNNDTDYKISITALNKQNVVPVENQANTYIMGPIKVNVNNTSVLTGISDSININTTSRKYTDASGKELSSQNLKDLINKDFYIKFVTTADMGNSKNIKYSCSATFKTRLNSVTGNVYYKANRQPILEINKTFTSGGDSKDVTFKYNPPEEYFDVALTKQIAQIYRYDFEKNKYLRVYDSEVDEAGDENGWTDKSDDIQYDERLKKIDTSTIEDSGNAKYMMDKSAITVLPGDIIRYKITTYNEGNVDGYIGEITDYLPDGMELLTSEASTNYGFRNWANGSLNIYTYDKSTNSVKFKYSSSSSYGKKLDKYVGGDDLSSFSEYVECKVTNDVKQGQLLTNVAEISQYGYIDFNGTYIEANKTGVDIDSEEDNIFKITSSVTSKETYDANLERIKKIIYSFSSVSIGNVDKNFIGLQDDDDFEQVQVGEFDLALRKYISSINGTPISQSREPVINMSSVSRYLSSKTAAYYHTKKPLRVNLGDTVTYTIRIYNEGYFDGYAQEITDYLPEGLTYKEDSQINQDNNWVATTNADGTTTVKTDKLKDTLIPAVNGAEGFAKYFAQQAVGNKGEPEFSKFVQIECTVNSSGKNGGILTNIAEISSYAYGLINSNEAGEVPDENPITYVYADKEDVDIDSEQNNILEKLEENQVEASTIGYYNYQSENHNISLSTENDYKGLQDDDDFENVEVEPFDLALRKFITKINDTNIDGDNSREPKITLPSLGDLSALGTARYYHPKTPITVNRGDTVLYTIRVYNEGYKEGYAKEITDYLPEGLTYKEDSQINKDNNWVVTKNDDGTTTIKTNKLANELIQASNGTEKYAKLYQSQNGGNPITDADIFWKDVQVECIVESVINKKVLANVAEITNYGYNDADGNYIEANTEGVDRDSEENNVFGIVRRVTNTQTYYSYQNVNDVEKDYFEGIQDDDDFEAIIVESIIPYEFILNKVKSEDGNPLDGSRFTITKSGQAVVDDEVINGSKTIKEENASVNVTYNYTVKENESTKGYINILGKNTIHIAAYINENLELVLGAYKAPGVIAMSVEDEYYAKYGYYITDEEGNLLEDTKTDLYTTITVVANNEVEIPNITVTVPNKKIEGSYSMEILKTKENDQPLSGVSFKVKEGTNTAKTYGPTGADGKVTIVNNKEIEDVGVDKYTITEVVLNENPYIAVKDDIDVYVTKEVINEKYVASKVSFEEDKEVRSKQVELQDGKKVTITASISNGTIKITIPNNPIEGQYDVELIKVDQKDGKTPLPGVTFDITVKKDDKEVALYDIYGKEINTKGLVTDDSGNIALSNIKITEEATYTYEIVETKVPDGYTMIKDPIYLTVKTAVENYKYVITDSKIAGVAELDSTKNKVTVTVQNGQFDLALRKFITGVTNGYGDKQEVTTRIPVFKIDENGNYVYEHTKEPVLVANQNVVEYTIRVYNEGSIAGYAKEIKDDIPEGLEFLPDDETNKEYRWIMLDEEGNETDEVSEAKYIVTDYLSKENEETDGENLLKAFDEEAYEAGSIKEPDYKEVKVAFKVTMPNTSDEIIINQAQISDDSDEDGNEVTDKDSTPNEWIDGEDDQDIEKIKVQYFDLALRKWVTKAIVIENGVETITETGHKAEDDPEAVVKVDLKKSKLDKVVVKFEYQIRVTNEGQIAGSVEEISDYIPQGLKFVAADNPEWEEVEGKVVTDQLAGQIIQPGESKEVTILLTWINREDNMGLKVNVAEISKDYNEYGSPDIDSTPNNQVPGEDDIDDAPVMLTVTTGQAVMYIGITIAVLGILAGGVIGIKKFVIK